jgi:hypothetical protein
MSIVGFLNRINTIILNPILVLLFAVALLYFLYGVFTFVKNADNDKERPAGQRAIVYGLIGMFVMFSAFSIIRFVLATFGISDNVYPFQP